MNPPLKLVLINDDGIDAPGIAALRHACAAFGTATVVAPDAPQSGVGHRVTTHEPIRVVEEAPSRYRVSGTPSDCARIAATVLVPDADWVLAGINRGGNLGSDVYMSGTVAAAREAALLGFRAISVSQLVARDRDVDWTVAASRTARVLRMLMDSPPDPGSFWSVNLPHPDHSRAELEVVFCELDPSPHSVRFRREGDLFVYEGNYHLRPRVPGRDVDVCFRGGVTVTRMPLDGRRRAR